MAEPDVDMVEESAPDDKAKKFFDVKKWHAIAR